MPSTTLDALRIYYDTIGHGPDVVLLHGWISSSRMWTETAATLAAAGFRAWMLDLPGFGDSAAPQTGEWYSMEAFAQVVADFCADRGITRAAFVGHSMGSIVTLSLGLDHPALAERLVTVSTIASGRVGLPVHHPLRDQRVAGWLEPTARVVWPAVAELGRWSSNYLSGRLARDTRDWSRADSVAALAALRAVVRHDLTERLHRLQQPVLLIHGRSDRVVPVSESKLAAQLIPHARLELLDGVYHLPSDERPQEFQRLLVGFLNEPVKG
jgi:pimeloyl-ACP methyl ester carboxylesterase